METINKWKKMLSNYKRIKYSDAVKLSIYIHTNENSKNMKKEREYLINSTFLQVLDYLESIGILRCIKTEERLEELISSSYIRWIQIIDSRRLEKTTAYSIVIKEIFDNNLLDYMGIEDYKIYDTLGIEHRNFCKIIYWFIEKIRIEQSVSLDELNKFINSMGFNITEKQLKELNSILLNMYELFYDEELGVLTVSSSTIEIYIYVILYEATRLLQFDIEKISLNYEDSIISKLSYEDLKNIINHYSKLNDIEKDVIAKRNGFENNEELSRNELATKYGLTSERIRQIEQRAYEILMDSPEVKRYKKI